MSLAPSLATSFLLAGLLLPAAPLASQVSAEAPAEGSPFEVSYDGLERVELKAQPALASTFRPEGAPVIYGATPDWFNDLRRQVGGVVAADMNGDGRTDLVVGCYNSSSFPPYDDWHNLIYFNTGNELEASPSWVSSDEVSTGEVKVADFNGDTLPDVFAANGGTAMAPSRIYYNTGTPSGPSTTSGWSEAGGATWTNYAAPFDFDHDGDVDVATANQGNSQNDPFRQMRLFLNNAGSLAVTPAWVSDETSIQNFLSWGDMNGDTWEDLAVSKWVNFESAVYLGVDDMGTRTLEGSPSWTTGDTDSDKGIGFADVDGVNGPDLALGHDPTQVFFNDGATLIIPPGFSANGTFFGHSDLKWGDVDGDGDPDLAEIHFSNGVANLYLNEGGTLNPTPVWSYDSSAVGTALDFGDIDGDGHLDIILAYAGDVSLAVFYNLASDEIFTDGFESGSTSAWSVVVP
jgi:hypothetical protein